MSTENYICHVCKINFLQNGMIFTGSKSNFRYRIKPDIPNKKFLVSIYTIYCYECAKDIVDNEFELSQNGYEQLREWLDNSYKEYLENHGVINTIRN